MYTIIIVWMVMFIQCLIRHSKSLWNCLTMTTPSQSANYSIPDCHCGAQTRIHTSTPIHQNNTRQSDCVFLCTKCNRQYLGTVPYFVRYSVGVDRSIRDGDVIYVAS